MTDYGGMLAALGLLSPAGMSYVEEHALAATPEGHALRAAFSSVADRDRCSVRPDETSLIQTRKS